MIVVNSKGEAWVESEHARHDRLKREEDRDRAETRRLFKKVRLAEEASRAVPAAGGSWRKVWMWVGASVLRIVATCAWVGVFWGVF